MNNQSNTSTEQSYFVTTGEFCRYANVSISTVKRMCSKGQLAHVVISERGDRRIPRKELDRLLIWAESNRQVHSVTVESGSPPSYPLRMVGVSATQGAYRPLVELTEAGRNPA